jgi:Ca-activated chloride channel family protein
MTFLWPEALVSLAAVPAAIAAYIAVLRQRNKLALRYASLDLVKAAINRGEWRRHIPPLVLLLAVVVELVAVARPAAVLQLPNRYETVILAIDISGSMRATDVHPDRMTAAQEAAKAFVASQPTTTRIGVVAFADNASLVQPPTQSREDVIAAIDRLQPQQATAIGAGILVGVKAIFPELELDLYSRQPRAPDLKPVPPGSYGSAVVVLLTDGSNTSGPGPVDAARIAADRGVRVYTVGIGTPKGTLVNAGGSSINVQLDEDALKQVAGITRAEYFLTTDAVDLKRIYGTLTARFVMEAKLTELTVFFTAVATLLALLAASLSVTWFGRMA